MQELILKQELYKQYGTTQPDKDFDLVDGELINVKVLCDSVHSKLRELRLKDLAYRLKRENPNIKIIIK